MVYGRSKVPPPATPFEEFMATTSEKMTAARLEFVEFLRDEGQGPQLALVDHEVRRGTRDGGRRAARRSQNGGDA